MQLYHQLTSNLVRGRLASVHEEDCFLDGARHRGVWLTTEPILTADGVLVDIGDGLDLAAFEVTAEGASHRLFVVPANLAADFACTASA